MRTTESKEMYLEVILQLERRNGEVRSVDIANELGYSKPSVSRAMRVLKDSGYIEHESYGSIKLTDLGRKKAIQMITRHETITTFLKSTLKIDAETAEEDACRIEHIISQKTADAIKQYADRMKQS